MFGIPRLRSIADDSRRDNGGREVKRFRKVLIAALTAALLLLQTTAAFGGDSQETGRLDGSSRHPAPLSFPSDPGEPDPIP